LALNSKAANIQSEDRPCQVNGHLLLKVF